MGNQYTNADVRGLAQRISAVIKNDSTEIWKIKFKTEVI